MKIAVNKETGKVANMVDFFNNDLNVGVSIYEENPVYEVVEISDEYYQSIQPDELNVYEISFVDNNLTIKTFPDVSGIQDKIDKLKTELAETDYIIIKAYEASLVKTEVGYDMNTIHTTRQSIRNKINELELLLKSE